MLIISSSKSYKWSTSQYKRLYEHIDAIYSKYALILSICIILTVVIFSLRLFHVSCQRL